MFDAAEEVVMVVVVVAVAVEVVMVVMLLTARNAMNDMRHEELLPAGLRKMLQNSSVPHPQVCCHVWKYYHVGTPHPFG